MPRRQLLSKVALVCLGTGVGVGLGELILRALPTKALPAYRNVEGDPIFAPDSLLGWRAAPDREYRIWSEEYDVRVRTNRLGLRGPDLGERPAESDCVVMALGDSFVQGLTVDLEDHFARVAERRIAAMTGRVCRIVPAGVEGYTTEQELLFFSRDLSSLSPSIVVHFFYFNDVVCNLTVERCRRNVLRGRAFQFEGNPVPRTSRAEREPAARTREDPTPGEAARAPLVGVRRWLAARSRIYRLARDVALGLERPGVGEITFRSTFFLRPPPQDLDVFQVEYDSETRAAWEITENLLVALADSVESRGSRFALLHVPMREALYSDEWDLGLRFQGWDEDEWDVDRVSDYLSDVCTRRSFHCIMLADAFRGARQRGEGRLYLTNDPHWNRDGHRVVGETLADEIVGLLGLGSRS